MVESNSARLPIPESAQAAPGIAANGGRKSFRLWWILAFTLALLQALVCMHSVSPDSISYLDLAEFIARGEWERAVNGYWNPLYPTLLAITLILNPFGPAAEAGLAHMVNFFAFLLLCWIFTRLVRQILSGQSVNSDLSHDGFFQLAFCLFLWCSLWMISLCHILPDMLVACSFLGASTLLLKFMKGTGNWKTAIGMGVTLALGYFSKAIMFPIGLLFCAVIPLAAQKVRQRVVYTVAVTATFLAVCSVYIVALSEKYGKATFSESGRLAHAWAVNGLPMWFHWQGLEPGSGTPEHPTRKILDQPPVYEFARPEGGTYPPWFDPAYWHEGLRSHLLPGKQIKALLKNLWLYMNWIFAAPVFVLILLLTGAAFFQKRFLHPWRFYLPLLVPPILGLGSYALVHVEMRYTAPFWLVIFLVLIAQNRGVPMEKPWRKAALGIFIVHFVLWQLTLLSTGVIQLARKGHVHYTVAQELAERGITEGDHVAVIGAAYEAYFARLANLQIVAEAPTLSATSITPLQDHEVRNLIDLFSETTARAVLTTTPPEMLPGVAWEQLSDSGFYFLPLP